MIPSNMIEFLVVTVTAAASFIGLLFVAITFVMNDENETVAERHMKRVLAESSYIALLSIFFISLVGLVPHTTIGHVTLIMALFGIGNTIQQFRHSANIPYTKLILAFSGLVYLCQGAYGSSILISGSNHYTSKYSVMTLMLFLFGIGLGRAWGLVSSTSQKRHS